MGATLDGKENPCPPELLRGLVRQRPFPTAGSAYTETLPRRLDFARFRSRNRGAPTSFWSAPYLSDSGGLP